MREEKPYTDFLEETLKEHEDFEKSLMNLNKDLYDGYNEIAKILGIKEFTINNIIDKIKMLKEK